MDQRQDFLGTMPVYNSFPMQSVYATDLEYEKDMERVKEMYPREVFAIMKCVEQRCDELEFVGSRLFDEVPDRFMMQLEANGIYKKVRIENDDPGWLESLVGVIFANEIYRRRCKNRRCNRWW